MTLLHALRSTVLSVAAVFQRPALLLQADDLLAREAVQLLVQLAHRQRYELVVVEQVAAHRVVIMHSARLIMMMTAAARSRSEADHQSRPAHLRS